MAVYPTACLLEKNTSQDSGTAGRQAEFTAEEFHQSFIPIRSEKAAAEAKLKTAKTISRRAFTVNKKQGILYSLTTCLYMLD
jgi:hypothetical protein